VPNRATWHQQLLGRLIYTFIRLLSMTLRWKQEGMPEALEEVERAPAIFVIWHNRLSMCLEVFQRYIRDHHIETRRLAAVVSASRDGAMLAEVLKLYRVEPVRGSTSRRGPQALRELVSSSRKGFDLAITPDGPRGPCYVMQEGPIALAQLTGMAVIPVSIHFSWKISLRSWDRFQIPLPGSKCQVRVGKPIHVPRKATPEEREALRLEAEAELRRLTED
jgi:lysophospholipid acyltransferase (LPLAT)-like uncharacterized protein